MDLRRCDAWRYDERWPEENSLTCIRKVDSEPYGQGDKVVGMSCIRKIQDRVKWSAMEETYTQHGRVEEERKYNLVVGVIQLVST